MYVSVSLVSTLILYFSLPSDALPVENSPEVLFGQCPNDQLLVSMSDDLRSILREKVIPALSCSVRGLGSCSANPATSCKQIAEQRPDAPSGDYWIQLCNGSAMQVYCDMNSRCCNSSSGWMRAAFLNMTDPSQECPAGLRLDLERRVCRKKVGAGCSSIFFPMYFLPYTRICGRIVAYQESTPDAFWQYYQDQTTTLDNNYIDGYSITVGYPRTHVWSFAAAHTEGGDGANSQFSCPCARTDVDTISIVPPFVGDEYFCESGASNTWGEANTFYEEDPLWDGEGCPENSECCTLNNPPWFCKELENEFRSDIEVRYCGDEHINNEEVPLELIELYVQ